jgi:hypothetical protein
MVEGECKSGIQISSQFYELDCVIMNFLVGAW